MSRYFAAQQEVANTLTEMNRMPNTHRLPQQHTSPTETTLQEIQHLFQRALEFMKEEKARLCFEVLSRIMDTLCTQCESLHLTNESALDFWREVNETWLFCLSIRHQGMTDDDWIAVRDSIIAWSDVLEWYGLVDYELGFWEEDILNGIHLRVHECKSDAINRHN